MRIGVTCYPTFGGSGVLASELGKFLAKRGHDIHFITYKVPQRLQSGFMAGIYFHEVEMTHYPLFEFPPYDMVLASKMREVFLAEKLDLLHVHYAIPHALCAFLASEMVAPGTMPIVTTLHGTDITLVGQEKGFYDITRLGINRSTVVTAVSDYLKRETHSLFRPEVEVERVYNFVDLELFRRSETRCRRGQFAGPGQVIYVHISNFRKVKRIPDVIRVFAKACEKVDAVLLLVGEGPELRGARELAGELNVIDRVRFLGKQDDVMAILGCSDVLLFPSEVESFGLAPLEAMACEVPVIATDSGGVPEVVLHGECGFLAAVGDVEAMSEYAIRLGLDLELRAQMGRNGRKRAESHFHPDAIVPQYELLYEKAIRLAKTRK